MTEERKRTLAYASLALAWALMITASIILLTSSCAKVEVGTLATSKISFEALEKWNAHSMGRFAARVRMYGSTELTAAEWRSYKWHRQFSDRLDVWRRVHNEYIDLALKESITIEDEKKLLELYNEVVALMNELIGDAKRKGYMEAGDG